MVEGEKCADAARDVFPWHIVTTWSHGCQAWKRTNWELLAGREVLLVADAEVHGRAAMEAVAKHLHSLGCKVRIYLPEGDDGKDIVDWIKADGAADVRERIEVEAKPWPPMDWKDDLAERAKTDPGAPFEPDTVVKLAGLRRDNPPEWQRLRRELRKAKILIGDLEPAMADVAREDGDSLQGQPLHWDEVEPCPDPVDGAALLDELVELIRKHASLPDGGAEAVVLWALYAWCFRAFGVCPNLMITAPERESGKTCVTELLSWMVPRPKPVSDASAAAIIRTIEHACPTLLFDEAQHFLRRRPEDPIRGILLASFVKRFASVDRCEGERNKVRVFSTFTPKAMNGRNLANLDDMLTSRSVVIPMTRATKRYPHIRPDRDPVGCGITGKCARWRDDHSSTLADADPDMGHLWGRIADVWRPLFAIADAAGGEWPALARAAATNLPALTATVADGETLGVQLLEDIHQVFKDEGDPDEISTADLDRELNEMSERPWPTLNNGKPMTAQKRGRLLSPYGIRTETLRFSRRSAKGYRRTAFREAWDAYLSQKAISEPLHRCNPHLPTDSRDTEPLQRRTGATVSDPPNSVLTNDCNGATVPKPEGAGESSADAEDSATSTGHDGGPSRNEVPRLDEQDPDYPTTL